jgi:cobaltochelatase CobN
VEAATTFVERLKEVSIAVKNQDNREHDLFDSDDYFQEHGGMIACVRALTGKNPVAYFGDSANPELPKVRTLAEEAPPSAADTVPEAERRPSDVKGEAGDLGRLK